METVLDKAIKDSIPIWDKCIEMPFIKELCLGSIDDDRMLNYIIEDTIYLLNYARCFAHLITKCDTLEKIRFFYSVLGFVNEKETSSRRMFIKEHGLNEEDVEKKEAHQLCKKYLDHMNDCCKNKSLEEGLMSMLPCILSYQYIFYKVYEKNPNMLDKNKYRHILEPYVDPNYKLEAQRWIDFSNKILCNSKIDEDKLIEAFRISSICELDFWKMSYEKYQK